VDQPRYVSAADCERLLTPVDALETAETALRWEAASQVLYPEQRALRLTEPESGFHYHSKVVAIPELGVAGARIVGYRVADDGSRPGAAMATRMVVLMDLASGAPLAIVDEHYNYALRTAASMAVAARIVRPGPVHLGLIGAGTVAQACIPVMLEAMDVTKLTMFSRTISRCEQLAELTSGLTGADIQIAGALDEVVERCDVVLTATTARAPIYTGAIRPGIVICVLGTNELDAAAYLSADRLVVDDWTQTQRASDIAPMIAAGHPIEQHLSASLPELVVAGVGENFGPSESVIIRTEGLASQDIMLAHRVWEASR
jgi:ornithine cyclodeaminase/alanine dehydrogenase-like protein (mu-crystallin family)